MYYNCTFGWALLKLQAFRVYLEPGVEGDILARPACCSQDVPPGGGGQFGDHLRIDPKGHSSADDVDASFGSRLQLYHINETRGLLKKINSVLQKITDPIQPKVAEHRPQTMKRLSYPFSREKQHL